MSEWPMNRNHREADLAAMRAASIVRQELPTDTVFTCDNCAERLQCDLVFDGYNTNGDCLADK